MGNLSFLPLEGQLEIYLHTSIELSLSRATLGKAAELAGLNRLTFMGLLTQQGIVVFNYDESALATDLTDIAELVDSD